jgi:peptidase M41-like protein
VTSVKSIRSDIFTLRGRVAEEYFLEQPSNLCESDFAVATALAHEMIARWGMNKTTGLTNDQLVRQRTSANLGKGVIYIDTNETSRKEIMPLLEHAYTLAFDHIEKHASQIVDWAAKLFEEETLRTTWLAKQRYSHEFKTNGSVRITQDESVTRTRKVEGEIVDIDVTESLSDKTLKLLRKQKKVLEMQIAALGEFHAPPEMIVRLEYIRERIARMKAEGGT